MHRLFHPTIEGYSRIGDEGILLASDMPMLYKLNQLSCEIWELIDGETPVGEIIAQIQMRYPTIDPKIIEADVLEYLLYLQKNKLIDTNEA